MDLKPRLLKLLSNLVRFQSISPNDCGIFEYIIDYLAPYSFKYQFINRNKTRNLICEFGTGNKIFAFAGHVDVVPAGDNQLWLNQAPFELYLLEDKLIGRGVSDMKGAITAFILALEYFLTKNINPRDYKILLLLTGDEEGAALDGSKLIVNYLIEQGIRLNYCIIGEPSSKHRIGDAIKIGRRGSLSGKLTINGLQGHIAYPEKAKNPIHLAIPLINELLSISWGQGMDGFPATSFQIANINAGLGVSNVIPQKLDFDFNFRYNPSLTGAELVSRVEGVLQNYNLDYTLTWNHSAKPFITKKGLLLEIVGLVVYEVNKVSTGYSTSGGTSDGRFLIKVCDELCELGLRNDTIHQTNETILVSELETLTKIYFNILNKIFNGKASL